MIGPQYLGLAYGLSELALARMKHSRRSRGRTSSRDAGTLGLVWGVIGLSVAASILVARDCPWGRFGVPHGLEFAALGLFVAGIALRAWSVLVLGRFFTVDVAIHADHELVTRGPYRVLRHPSYSGALLAVLGMGALFGSLPGLLVLLGGFAGALARRIAVEERALAQNFGERWTAHCARTWRLVPFVW